LITDDSAFADAVGTAIESLLETLPRATIAGAAWRAFGAIIVVQTWQQAANLANRIAPEHLQVMTANAQELFAKIRHAGAAFLGDCPVAIGDYIAGPNHVLPTSGTARFASGLSVYDFLKRTSWVSLAPGTIEKIGPAAIALATSESLSTHAQSIAARLSDN
jgi:histidinol dehydrogenase